MRRGTARDAVGSIYAGACSRTFSMAWCRILPRWSDREASIVPPFATIPMRFARSALRFRVFGAALVWLFATTGCVTVYQPMSGLHSPVIVETTRPNLRDTRIDLACVPGGGLSVSDATALCGRVQRLFENQGALVTSGMQLTRDPAGTPEEAASPPSVHLTMEITSRKVHESNHPLTWMFSFSTFTLVPAVTELTFAQDVTIRDASGFLLVKETLQGRIVRRFGAGTWLVTHIGDLWRPEDRDLGGDAANRDLSRDLYRRLSQLAFDARIHADVLRIAAPAPAPPQRLGPPDAHPTAPEVP